MATVNNIYSSMLASWERLDASWKETCEVWNDPVRRQFQRDFQQPLEVEALAVRQELAKLIQVIGEAHRRVQRVGNYGNERHN